MESREKFHSSSSVVLVSEEYIECSGSIDIALVYVTNLNSDSNSDSYCKKYYMSSISI